MEMMHESVTSNHARSRKMFRLLFDRSIPAGRDVRGTMVLDRHHRSVGTICEVYCDRETHKPRYVEIVPNDEKSDRVIMYPYDDLRLGKADGPAIASVAYRDLLDCEAFEYGHVMQIEGSDLVTIWTALETCA